MRLSFISRGHFITIFLGLVLLILGCFCDKTIGPDITKPHEISFQQTALDSLYISTVATSKEGILFASSTVGDLYRSLDKGEIWKIVLSKFIFFHMAFKANGDIFACYSGGPWTPTYVLRSTDNGLTWTLLPNPGKNPTSFVFNQSGEIFLGDMGGESVNKGDVYKSTDNGDTWQITGFPDSVGVFSMIITENGNIFAGTQKGIYQSHDNSNTWVMVYEENSEKENLKRPHILHFAINPVNKDLYAASPWEIFRSIDNGENWMKIEWPTIYSTIMSLVINSRGDIFIVVINSPGIEFQNGLYYSTDEGKNWKKIDNGLKNVIVDNIAIDPFGYLYAGTVENGVFRTKYSTTE